MKIELIRGWNGHSPGTIIEPQLDDVGNQLIKRGFAKRVDEEPKKRPAKLQEWVNTADRLPPRNPDKR